MGPAVERGHKLFVAVPLPETASIFALRAQSALSETIGVRWVERTQLHCTVAFIGRSDPQRTAEAKAVVGALPADCGGEAWLRGLLFLPDRHRARVLALGVEDDKAVFAGLYEVVMSALEVAGVMKRDQRHFRPHVTIGRFKEPGKVQLTVDCESAVFGVDSVCLYESVSGHQGAVHTVLVRKEVQWAYGQKMA